MFVMHFHPEFSLLNTTPVAKPVRASDPVKGNLAFNKIADISQIVRVMSGLFIVLSAEVKFGS